MMKTTVQKLLSDRWARHTISEAAFGRTLPMRSMGKFLAAAFITWCAVGFVIDLLLLNYQPLARGSSGQSTLARLGQPFLRFA
jgi:hypothetical protein